MTDETRGGEDLASEVHYPPVETGLDYLSAWSITYAARRSAAGS
ncbi:hypothetical protein PYK79_03870 [Streptomyces sp. ID05-04B]|nr:hypothetical protein [Streptomyces sp. ID05-04B]